MRQGLTNSPPFQLLNVKHAPKRGGISMFGKVSRRLFACRVEQEISKATIKIVAPHKTTTTNCSCVLQLSAAAVRVSESLT